MTVVIKKIKSLRLETLQVTARQRPRGIVTAVINPHVKFDEIPSLEFILCHRKAKCEVGRPPIDEQFRPVTVGRSWRGCRTSNDASSLRRVGSIRGSVQDDLSIKSLAMKAARPNIFAWIKDKLDVNL